MDYKECDTTYSTYKAVLVTDVVRQLQLVEGDHLLHPLLTGRGGVGVDVHPLGHLGVRLASHHPAAAGPGHRREDTTIRKRTKMHFLFRYEIFLNLKKKLELLFWWDFCKSFVNFAKNCYIFIKKMKETWEI